MKSILFIIIISITSWTHLAASLDTCYQIVEVVEGVDFEIGVSLLIDLDEQTISFNDDAFTLSDTDTYQTGNKQSLITHLDCIYDFDRFDDVGIFTASTLRVESLGMIRVVTHHLSEIAYVITQDGVYIGVPCPGVSNDCISPRYRQAELADVDYTLTAIPQGAEFTISPPQFDLVSEQVLVQDAYNILTVDEHEFERVTEQRVKTYTNICPQYDAVYSEIEEEVLVKDSYSVLTVVPARFELVLEEVLASSAYIDVAVISVADWSQPYLLEATPSYIHYSWLSDQDCSSHNPYDCVEVLAEQVPTESLEVSEPSTWTCNSESDWSHDVLLISDVQATYRTRSYFRLQSPATTTAITIPAETKLRTYIAIDNLSEIPDTCIQIAYEIDTSYRLAVPATALSQDVPAQYKTRQYLRLIVDGQYAFDLPQSFCTAEFDGQRIISPASMTFGPHLCDVTDILRQEAISLSLFEAGDLEVLSTPYASGLFWESLFDFQSGSDEWDIGPLNAAQAQFLDRP